jgi:predicted membrane protein
MTSTDSTGSPPQVPPEAAPAAPRQKFPSGKQALVGCLGSLVLSFTTCTTVLVVFGEREVNDFEAFLIGLTVFICVIAPLVGLVIVFMYFERRRSYRRVENHST